MSEVLGPLDYNKLAGAVLRALKDTVIVEAVYGADLTKPQSVAIDVAGFKLVEAYAESTSPTTFRLEFSFDGKHWLTYYESPAPELKYNDVILTAARYMRLSSQPAGAAGDKVTLVLAAKP